MSSNSQAISKVYFEHKSDTDGQLQGRFNDPARRGGEHDIVFVNRSIRPGTHFEDTYKLEEFNVPDNARFNFGVLNPDTGKQSWAEIWHDVSYSASGTAHIVYTSADKVEEKPVF